MKNVLVISNYLLQLKTTLEITYLNCDENNEDMRYNLKQDCKRYHSIEVKF